MRADELNFPGVRQIDYASIIDLGLSLKQPSSTAFGDSNGPLLQGDVCKQCQEFAFKAISTNAQKVTQELLYSPRRCHL